MTWTTPRTWVDGETITASIFNTHVRDNLGNLYFGDASWRVVGTDVPFQSLWTSYDAINWTVRYRKVGLLTTIQGLVKGGTLAAPAFTLEAGYRPAKYLIFATSDANSAATSYQEVRVLSTGAVVPQVAQSSGTYISVSCTFMAEQ